MESVSFYSTHHIGSLFIRENFLRNNYSLTTRGKFNAMIPFTTFPLYSLTLYHQVGKPEWGPSLQPVPVTLCLAGWLAGWLVGSCSCLGFLAFISKWAACAS